MIDALDMEKIADLRQLAEAADHRSWGCKFLRQGTLEALDALVAVTAERDALAAKLAQPQARTQQLNACMQHGGTLMHYLYFRDVEREGQR